MTTSLCKSQFPVYGGNGQPAAWLPINTSMVETMAMAQMVNGIQSNPLSHDIVI